LFSEKVSNQSKVTIEAYCTGFVIWITDEITSP